MDRRLLTKVDRRLLSEMEHSEGVQLVKVPVSAAVWSTWRRYCEAIGVSMGRGLAVLLQRELASVVDEDLTGLTDRLAEREAAVVAREAELARVEEELAGREAEVAVRERRMAEVERTPAARSGAGTSRMLGRNDPCWCGSGGKYKACHLRKITRQVTPKRLSAT